MAYLVTTVDDFLTAATDDYLVTAETEDAFLVLGADGFLVNDVDNFLVKAVGGGFISASVTVGTTLGTGVRIGAVDVIKARTGSVVIWEAAPVYSNSFVTVWRTTAPAETITLPIIAVSGYSHNFLVDWGDNTQNIITDPASSNRVHAYASAGDYVVTITGEMPGFKFNNTGDRLKLQQIRNWGQTGWKTTGANSAFYGCSNMTCTATDVPNMSAITTLGWMFRSCELFNGNISGWDVSGVTDIGRTFQDCTNFNSDISGWNTANMTDFVFGFSGCTNFNQNISTWNTVKVTNLQETFSNCSAFDQNLGGWNIALVTNLTSMFLGATLSTANYDALLIGWAAQAVQTGRTFHAGTSKYTAGGAAAAARLTLTSTKGWVITDGGTL